MSIFRRMFTRKDNNITINQQYQNRQEIISTPLTSWSHSPKSVRKFSNTSQDNVNGIPVLQLTPLWEHIIRTRTLPENLDPDDMFNEFLERLKDPEWQVRQHALRVLIDVLLVLGQKSDTYFHKILSQLVENLGHPAPTVRKGALDCLRVYLSETAMAESIVLEILDIGLNQRITNEPFGGRLTCSVMLSLPLLIQTTLESTKRSFILQSTIEMLIAKMTQITHQEVTLKVLNKIENMIGQQEFAEYMSEKSFKEYELLCNVYGIHEELTSESNSLKSWRLIPSFESESDTYQSIEPYWKAPATTTTATCKDKKAKVILETEIKINDDTLTMRILEASDDNHSIFGEKTENGKTPMQINNNNINNNRNEITNNNYNNNNNSCDKNNKDKNGIFTDSEIEEINYSIINHSDQNNNLDITDNTPRTPKRVTFGGEIIKMRTPDSDTTIVPSDFDDNISTSTLKPNSNLILNNIGNSQYFSKLLTVEIANDNTKPIVVESKITSSRPNSASPQLIRKSNEVFFNQSPKKYPSLDEIGGRSQRPVTSSPKSPFKRISVSPVDDIISPIAAHKEIEVLHNLQREISPKRPLSKTITSEERTTVNMVHTENGEKSNNCTPNLNTPETIARSWEDLGIVQPEVIQNLKSGDWRYRSNAICQIEDALKSSDNLAIVQPSLDSLFRTLLSSEKNSDVAEDKRRVITNLISRLPLDNLENRTAQIITGLCRQGGPGSNRVSKTLMQRLPPAVIVLKLLSDEFLHARSSRFRENALQMVMYALTTFPSTCFDTSTCIKLATLAALDRKKRVRQASLDVLAILGQVTSPKICLDTVQNTLKSLTDISSSDANELSAAIKARLTRKQLPYITPDGFVHYTLKVPSPQQANDSLDHIGADVQWIVSGIGSVSPTSMKRRLRYSNALNNNQNSRICISEANTNRDRSNGRQIRPPHEILAYSVGVKHLEHNEETTKHGPPKATGEIIGINGRRIATKSSSDSLSDSRNIDTTYENPFKQHSVTSRFPVMENLNGQRMSTDRQQAYQNPYNVGVANGNRFNVTYPRPSYSVYRKKHYYDQENLNEGNSDTNYGYSLNSTTNSNIDNLIENKKRFMNVEKFMQSNKQQIYSTDSIHHQNFNNFYQDEIKYKDEKEVSRTPCCENRFIPSTVHESIDQINNQTYTESSNNESSEISSSDDRVISSSHSTPNRIAHILPPKTNGNTRNESITSIISRPPSGFRLKELINEEDTLEDNLPSTPAISLKNYSRPQSGFSDRSFMVQEHSIDSLNNVNEPDDFNKIDEIDADEHQEPQKDIHDIKTENFFNRSGLEDIETIIGFEEENYNNNNTNDFESNVQEHDNYDVQPIVELISTSSSSADIPSVEIKILSRPQSNLSRPQSVISRSQSNISKSCESIYQSLHKEDLEVQSTVSTATSSEYPPSQAASVDCPLNKTKATFNSIKSKQSVPPLLARKSKTTLFGSRNRRVSPIKQSLKLTKTELYPQTLVKFDKPKDGVNTCFQQLESQNWEIVMNGLVSIVRLMRHHTELIDMHMHMVIMLLSKTVKNLRSQVSRAACQAATEFFTIQAKFLEQECDDLVGSLLHRSADTNRFLRADANRALMSMCDNLSPPKVLHLLTTRGLSHQNAVVRTTTAKLLNRLVDRLGCDKVYAMSRENREKIFLNGATLLQEGSLETRSYAKAFFKTLSDHSNYNRYILEYIPTRIFRNIEKTLRSIK